MRKKKGKRSIPEKILELGNYLKSPKTAEEIKRELKDSRGHNLKRDQIRMALIRLLRADKIKRKKVGKIYKYCI